MSGLSQTEEDINKRNKQTTIWNYCKGCLGLWSKERTTLCGKKGHQSFKMQVINLSLILQIYTHQSPGQTQFVTCLQEVESLNENDKGKGQIIYTKISIQSLYNNLIDTSLSILIIEKCYFVRD